MMDDAGRANLVLRAAQALLRAGVWEWDLTTETLAWSDELYRIFGVSPGDVAPGFEALLGWVHPEDQAAVRSYFARTRRDGAEHTIEYRIVRPGGELRVLQSRARATLDERGVPRYVVGTEQDITESRELAARVAFADRMVSIGTLAGGVAHEINNSLAVISANLELLSESADDDLTREALQSVGRIGTTVRGLMALSRGETSRRTKIDLHRVLDLAIALTSNETRHHARLVKHYGTPPMIDGNEAQLGQVFLNLLLNAAAAIPDGHADQHEITIATRSDDAGWAVIEIRDTGTGIAAAIRDRIFEPFFTTKPAGSGTGLGLSIGHAIVRSLGGELGMESELGKGSVFRVILPPSPGSAVRAAPAPRARDQAPRRGKLLIVDDEALFSGSLRRLFSNEYDVTVMNSGREALSRLRAGERFDVIVCDLMMPEISGAELHAELLRIAPEQTDRMIFLTGGAFSLSSQHFLDGVTNRWFEKPCNLHQLRDAVRKNFTNKSCT